MHFLFQAASNANVANLIGTRQRATGNRRSVRAPVIRPAERWLRTGDLAEVATEVDGRGRARPLLALGAVAVAVIGGVFLLSGAPGFLTDRAGGTAVVTDPVVGAVKLALSEAGRQ